MREMLVWLLLCIAPTPLAIDARGGVGVDVEIDGNGPFRFILDTGATRSIIADDLALEIAAPVVARSEVVTSGGSDMRPVVRLGSVTLARARVDALLAPVVPAARLAPLGRGVRGLLGQDFLSAFNYTLDYRRHLLRWDEPRTISCEHDDAIRLRRSEGRFVMALEDETGAPLRLVPDSGAEALVLFRASDRKPDVLLSGLTGERGAQLTRMRRLVVGSVTLHDLPALVVDRHEPDVDGLMPLHGFSSVSFAAGGGCVVVRK